MKLNSRKPPTPSYAFDETRMLASIREYNAEQRSVRQAQRAQAEEAARRLSAEAQCNANLAVRIALQERIHYPHQERRQVPPRRAGEVFDLVCGRFKITRENLTARNRNRELLRVRYIAMAALRYLDYTFPQIGRLFNMHHTSVISGTQRAAFLSTHDPQFAQHLAAIKTTLKLAELKEAA